MSYTATKHLGNYCITHAFALLQGDEGGVAILHAIAAAHTHRASLSRAAAKSAALSSERLRSLSIKEGLERKALLRHSVAPGMISIDLSWSGLGDATAQAS